MAKTLKGLVITEVEQIIYDTNTLKEAASKIGVAYQTLLQFRSENMKGFKKLKAQREQGLIFEDEPVIKTKAVGGLIQKGPVKATVPKGEVIVPLNKKKGASEIPVVETIEKSKYDELEVKYNELDSKHIELGLLEAVRRDEIASEKNEKLKLTKENERLRDQIERLKKNKADAEEQQKESTRMLNDRSKKAEDAMRAATMRIEQLEKKVEEQNKVIQKKNETIQFNVKNALKIEKVQTELEQDRANEVAKYEQSLKQLEQEVQSIGTERDEWKGKYLDLDNAYKALESDYEDVQASEPTHNNVLTDDSQYVMLPANENLKLINPPIHYATADGTDLIQRFADKKKRDFFVGAMVFNINKYCERFGDKDNELSEARKIKDYSTRLVDYLEQEQSELMQGDISRTIEMEKAI
ncbi:DUF3310 domain-containing protein [Macrococcus animalis]|uniref:DUF3310 domain-containing protein n=1 Tax=Macrococcus animalis TaxID=3395467 RepID=UPI0039BE11D3